MTVPTREQFLAMRALWALTVPAYKRGHDLICTTVAQLPLRQHDTAATPIPPVLATNGEPPYLTMTLTVSDLVNHGVAFWRITGTVYAPRFTRMNAADCTISEDGRTVTDSRGVPRTVSDPLTDPVLGQVVVIRATRDGCVTVGGDVLTTGLALAAATRNYAEQPHPSDILRNVSGYELSDQEITDQLDAWRTAREAGSVAYMNPGFELAPPAGWSPTELALAEQRNVNTLDVARLLNLDASWLNAVVGGSSLVYTNRVDLRQDLIDLTCAAYTLPIEQRLSGRDCYGGTVRFSVSAFLRGNTLERANLAIALTAAQIITADEARAMISDRPGELIA